MKIRYSYICLTVFVFLILSGCSTKRNTAVTRQYHRVTTHFNVLFNGKDAFTQGMKKAEKAEPAGFDEILPVFSFEIEEVPGLISSDMQRAIEKTKKSIEKHSITAKPKRKAGMTKEDREFYNKREFNVLIDDAYFLMAQANTFLRDYDEAKRIYEFARLEYPKESTVYDTRLWYAIVQAQTNDLSAAENTYKLLEKDKKLPEHLIGTLYAAWADLKIKQQKYPEAITYLEKALEHTRRKATKIRYNYILAQLYERQNDKAKAINYYDKVIKMNPPYYTSFNAQMAKAFSYDPATQSKDIRKTLDKALKDPRNEEYLDQIYYALATVEKNDNNVDKAIEYYKKSISIGGINDRQKALAYNALATHYYDVPDYVKSYYYYDSAARFIGVDHSRYEQITGRVQQLKKLAENLEIIQNQDSLQRIAQMPAAERNKLIDKQIEQVAAIEKAQQEQEQQRREQINLAERGRFGNETAAQTSGGQWYFYNTTALGLGLSDFQMRWGRRRLEDNWRRRNKGMQVQDFEPMDNVTQNELLTLSESEKQKLALTPKDAEYYLLDVPVGEEAMQESNKRIVNAMFNVGEAYRDDMKNYEASIKAFEDLNSRFPNSELQPQSYIALYNLYREQGNLEKANQYRNLMAQMYPNNPQVKATLDPTYVAQLQAQEAAAERAYMQAVNQYTMGNYQQALNMAEQVITTEPDNTLLPQYYLLRALTVNYAGDTAQYKTAMNEVIEKYPNNDVAVQAKALLADLDSKRGVDSEESILDQQPEEVIKVNYSPQDGEHFFGVMVNLKGDVNAIKFNITARNADMYLKENYDVTDEDMGQGNKMILVGTFRNKAAAMKYYQDAMRDKATIFEGELDSSYIVFVISDINLFLLKESKYFKDYYDFFLKNYLNQK